MYNVIEQAKAKFSSKGFYQRNIDEDTIKDETKEEEPEHKY